MISLYVVCDKTHHAGRKGFYYFRIALYRGAVTKSVCMYLAGAIRLLLARSRATNTVSFKCSIYLNDKMLPRTRVVY